MNHYPVRSFLIVLKSLFHTGSALEQGSCHHWHGQRTEGESSCPGQLSGEQAVGWEQFWGRRERRRSTHDKVAFGEDSECWLWLYSFICSGNILKRYLFHKSYHLLRFNQSLGHFHLGSHINCLGIEKWKSLI